MNAHVQPRLFKRDSFLEAHLGYPVLRLQHTGAAQSAIRAARQYDDWLIEGRVLVEQTADLAALTELGFRLIDTNVQLVREPGPLRGAPGVECRFAEPMDEDAVRAIAARSFSRTRFHLDPAIPNAVADRIKEEWAANFFAGRRGEWMVVAQDEGKLAGFCQLLRGPQNVLVIDLVAVAEAARGKGLARAMIAYAASECLGRHALMQVGTQIANVESLAVYAGLGFRVASASYVLHMHAKDRRS